MFCAVCKSHKKNAFGTVGSSNYRRSALTDHSKSLEHSEASHEASQATPMFASAIQSADKAMLKAAYFIALAVLKFEKLI